MANFLVFLLCQPLTVNENFAGLLNFLLPILAAIPLVGFLIQTDVPGLSFIQVCSFLCLHTV